MCHFFKTLVFFALLFLTSSPAKAQIVGVLAHLQGVEAVDFVSNVQAWVSTKTTQMDGAPSSACSLIYFQIPKSMGDMGAPVSFVARGKNNFQIRALNTEWPILPDQTGRLSLKIGRHTYPFKLHSNEGGVILGPVSGTALKEIFNALSEAGKSPYNRMILTYAELKSAKDDKYAGTSNGAINNLNTDRRSRAEEAKQRRLNRASQKVETKSFSIPIRGISKTIETFQECVKTLP